MHNLLSILSIGLFIKPIHLQYLKHTGTYSSIVDNVSVVSIIQARRENMVEIF